MATATKQGPTVRISETAHNTLRELASSSGEAMQTVLDKALEHYKRERFWEEMDAAYAVIENDPKAMAAEQQERALWDAVLMDGIDPNEAWRPDGTVIDKGDQHG